MQFGAVVFEEQDCPKQLGNGAAREAQKSFLEQNPPKVAP